MRHLMPLDRLAAGGLAIPEPLVVDPVEVGPFDAGQGIPAGVVAEAGQQFVGLLRKLVEAEADRREFTMGRREGAGHVDDPALRGTDTGSHPLAVGRTGAGDGRHPGQGFDGVVGERPSRMVEHLRQLSERHGFRRHEIERPVRGTIQQDLEQPMAGPSPRHDDRHVREIRGAGRGCIGEQPLRRHGQHAPRPIETVQRADSGGQCSGQGSFLRTGEEQYTDLSGSW